MVLYAFGVGLANFGRGREPSPGEIIASIKGRLHVVASYGATGNVALDDSDISEVRQVLEEVTPTAWAVVGAEDLELALNVLAEAAEPVHMVNERPTPGLAFAVTPPSVGDVSSTSRAVLRRVSTDIVAAWKLDLIRDGKLDSTHRRGGWGGVSADVARQVGGRWTARSRRTILGLRRRVIASNTT